MTTSRIGRGVLVTLAGTAASLAGAAGVANACDTTQPSPPTQGHHHDQTSHKKATTPATVCEVGDDSVQYAELAKDGTTVVGGWHSAVKDRFQGNSPEPVYGYQVRLNPDDANCTGSVDVSLASYDTAGKTWEESGGPQKFVDYAHVKLSEASKTSASQRLTVKLPAGTGAPTCFGQIDLYFGTTIYDGGTGPGHGPVPDHDHGIGKPTKDELITAWNGSDAGGCAVVTPPPPPVTTTTPPTTTPPTTPPTTAPSTHPSTPVTSTPTTPKSTSSTPTTPPTTTATPGSPTLAHTGANVGEVSLVALAFFGAGGTAMFASRKAKTAGARRH